MSGIGIIGQGAIARYVAQALAEGGTPVAAVLARPGREDAARAALDAEPVVTAAALAECVRLVVDCAGHAGLAEHGAALLGAGCDVVTLSLGALADPALLARLRDAADAGGGALRLASGAIGALDALAAASVGGLDHVRYTGTKPPLGWAGSPAEEVLDLAEITAPEAHFTGSARDAAIAYPKNANVAAAVALAGLGFDKTEVQLIADPAATQNIHRIEARGAFGQFDFSISGNALPDNPRSSALAAMSAVRAVQDGAHWMRF
ncbi:aspartate dehydrogenase [Pelagivirga sediminicola]|uniref:L-aspartate dehydrogenase n=1 Tax=Pelagivirga sediminicola TaxID=2170575 RepID=A0A2T7GB27_9RHOB|nr:aspartate dehydrogenase [Pelagivirga sediminicola]PVA11588.1 aspartate dehydrogenase [Pelagivirga sediminicola]